MVGMDGCFCIGDGCVVEVLKVNYGMGGMFIGMCYMILVMFNVLCEVFNNFVELFFEGLLMDDFLWLVYLNVKFFGMVLLLSFGVFDVMKNFEIDIDFVWFDVYLDIVFVEVDYVVV